MRSAPAIDPVERSYGRCLFRFLQPDGRCWLPPRPGSHRSRVGCGRPRDARLSFPGHIGEDCFRRPFHPGWHAARIGWPRPGCLALGPDHRQGGGPARGACEPSSRWRSVLTARVWSWIRRQYGPDLGHRANGAAATGPARSREPGPEAEAWSSDSSVRRRKRPMSLRHCGRISHSAPPQRKAALCAVMRRSAPRAEWASLTRRVGRHTRVPAPAATSAVTESDRTFKLRLRGT